MADTNDIQDIVFHVEVAGPEAGPASAAFEQIGGAADQTTASFNAASQASVALGDAVSKAGEGARVSDAAWRRLASSLDPYQAAVDRATRQQDQLNRLIGDGRGNVEDYARLQLTAASNLAVAQRAQEANTKAIRDASAALDEARGKAAANQAAALNQTIGIKLPDADVSARRAADIQAYGSALDALRAKFDPVFAVSKQYEQQLNEISEAQKAGAISAATAAEAQERARQTFERSSATAAEFIDKQRASSAAQQAAVEAAKNAAQAQAEINRLLNVQAPNEGAYAKRAADVEAYGQSLDALRAKYDPVFRVSKEYEAALNSIADAQKVGAISAATAASAQDQATAAFQKATGAVTDLEAKQIALAQANEKVAAAAKYAADYQQAINQSLGVRQTSQDDLAKRAADVQAYGSALDQLRAKFNPIFAVSKQYEAALKDISEAQKVGAISAREAEAAQERARLQFAVTTEAMSLQSKSLGQATASSNSLRFAMRDLGSQTIDLFQGLATGQPVLRTLIQQGAQVVQVNQAMGVSFSALLAGVRALAVAYAPLLAVVGTGAVFVALAASAELAAQRLGALRLSLSGARDDYVQVADSITKASKQVASEVDASSSDISKALRIFAVQGHFQGTVEDFKQVIRQAEALSKVLDTDLPTAAKLYATALADPLAAIKQLAGSSDTLKLVSASTLALAAAAAHSGETARATTILTNALNQSLVVQKENLTPLVQAWRDFREAFQPIGEGIESLGKKIGTFLIDQLTETIKEIQGTIEAFKNLGNMPIPHGPAVSGPQLSIGTSGPLVPGPYTAQLNQATATTGEFGQSLFQALIAAESSGQQYTQRGEVLLPGGGGLPTGTLPGRRQPVGIGQITPETASGVGFSTEQILTPAGNIGASGAYFTHIYQKYGGNPTLVVAAYNMGETALDRLLKLPPNQQQFPFETQQEQAKVLGTLYASGVSAPAGGFGQRAGQATGEQLPIPPIPPGVGTGASGQSQGAREAIAGNFGSTKQQIFELSEQLDKATAAFNELTKSEGSSAKVTLEQGARVENLKEQLKDLENPQRQAIRDLQNSAAAAGLLDEADQKLLEKRQQIAQFNASHHDNQISETQATAALAAVQGQLTAEFTKRVAVLDQDTQLTTKQAEAYGQGRQAANDNNVANQALLETMKSFSTQSPEFVDRWQQMTKAIKDNQAAQAEVKLAQMSQDLRDQSQVLQLEISTLGDDNDARRTMIDLLQTEQQLRKIPGITDEQIQGYIAEKRAIDDLDTTLRARSRDMDFVAGQFTSAFDTIGNAIATSFVQGQGAAVNFGNVMKSVAEQIIQSFLKLAIINPLINGLFGGAGGQTLPTLFSVGETLTGGFGGGGVEGGAGSGVGGGGGGFGQLLPVAGLASQATGVTGSGGLLSGVFSPVRSFLATPLTEGTASLPLYGPATASEVAATGVSEPGLATNLGISNLGSAGGAAPVTIGGLLGGFGAGFGIGSLAGGLLQKALGKTGPAPTIGAGVGAAAGAALGTFVFPVVGTLLGAILGGLIGGGGGGLIGPKPPSPYSASFVSIENGRLVVPPGLSGNQLMPSNVAMAQNQVDAFNQQTFGLGLRVGGTFAPPPAGAAGGLGFFGSAKNPQGIVGQNVTDAFSNVRFTAATDAGMSPDTIEVMNRALNRSFASFDELGKEVNKVRGFMEQTLPAFRHLADGSSSLNDALIAIDNQFNPAIKTAQELGYAEQELTDQRAKAIAKAQEAVNQQLAQNQAGYAARYTTAIAAISGDPQQQLAAALGNFDLAAQNERKSLGDSLAATFGDSIRQTQLYADQMAGLEKALGAERLQVQAQANSALVQQAEQQAQQMEQARATASQLITSIAEYSRGLKYNSATTPLSPQAQLAAAQRDFQAVAGAAGAGDATSLSKVTGYADTLLQSARSVYGSGQGYVQVFQQVTDALAKIGEVSPETLTNSVFVLETRTQTSTLADAIKSLQNEVAALRAQVAAGGLMPSRLAA